MNALPAANLEELRDLSSADQLKWVADRFAEIPEPLHRAARAMECFGRSGSDFLVICSFPKPERDELIHAHMRTFGWDFLRELFRS